MSRSQIPELIKRQRALAKTMARYRGRPFEWGRFDCVAMARAHLTHMGHRNLPKLPRYRDAVGAMRAMKAQGWGSLAEMLDALLPRVIPAMMWSGDLVLLPNPDSKFDALAINVGHKVWGWHDANGLVEPVPVITGNGEILGVWRT